MAVDQKNIHPVILAGGQGARFWPMSRKLKPKQFLSVTPNGESLIQLTVKRVEKIAPRSTISVVTNIAHQALVAEHVPGVQVISEPVGRNTAASVGLAATILARGGHDPVMLVLPADHYVANEDGLVEVWREAIELASQQDELVTIGLTPSSPNTGYGYIRQGKIISGNGYEVKRFFEKPNLERAIKYVESGEYLWNSGMFAWRASVLLQAINNHMPQLSEGLARIRLALGTKLEQKVISEVFSSLDSVSIDFGILELAKNCAVVRADGCGWSDVGSWDAWAEHFDKDEKGNLLYGDALVLEGERCVVHSQNRLIALLGIDDLVVIDAGDALLICPRGRVQDVRKVVDELDKRERKDII